MFTRTPVRLPKKSSADASSTERYMWSAVAMQQHMTRDLLAQGRLARGIPQPSAQRTGELSLAQKMGLVPAPPPPPEEAAWAQAEAQSKYRHDMTRPCSICHEAFVLSHMGGDDTKHSMVILNCSHVFHAVCIQQFERYARQERRPPRCPVCRCDQYYKRKHYAGAAQLQQHALTKLQAWFRGVIQRRRYVKLRCSVDPAFRSDVYFTRLQRYADYALAQAFVREKTVDDVLAEVALRREQAAAMLLSRAQWAEVRVQAITRASEQPGDNATITAVKRGAGIVECPICLGNICEEASAHRRKPVELPARPAKTAPPASTGTANKVAVGRAPPAARGQPPTGGQRRAPASTSGLKATAQPNPATRALPSTKPGALPPLGGQRSAHASSGQRHDVRSKVAAPATPTAATSEPDPATADPVGREGVVTSCGHCFHAQCLATLASFVAAGAAEGPPVVRCPVCRAAYASMPLFV